MTSGTPVAMDFWTSPKPPEHTTAAACSSIAVWGTEGSTRRLVADGSPGSVPQGDEHSGVFVSQCRDRGRGELHAGLSRGRAAHEHPRVAGHLEVGEVAGERSRRVPWLGTDEPDVAADVGAWALQRLAGERQHSVWRGESIRLGAQAAG